jgi:hypothetical protein
MKFAANRSVRVTATLAALLMLTVTMAVPALATANTPPPASIGKVGHVARVSPAGWGHGVEAAELNASDGAEQDQFGQSVAISADGSTAVVGAAGHNGGIGAVYVWINSGGDWAQTAELVPTGGAMGGFGTAVAIARDGSTIVVGAPNGDAPAAYVFVESDGSWVLAARLASAVAYFGIAVAVSSDGTTVAVGATFGAGYDGSAYVYSDAGGSWQRTAELTASDGQDWADFGVAVAVSADGTTVAVGAPMSHGDEGAAYVYGDDGGTWTQTAELTVSGVRVQLGWSVALTSRGGTLAAGAIGGDNDDGVAYVFSNSGEAWVETAELESSTGASDDWFGVSVALAAKGTVLAVGAPDYNGTAGTAYVFTLDHRTWRQSAAFSAPDGAQDSFGDSVAISAKGATALVGSNAYNTLTGAAFVYNRQAA